MTTPTHTAKFPVDADYRALRAMGSDMSSISYRLRVFWPDDVTDRWLRRSKRQTQ